MAILGRRTARHRLRRAARQALTIPAFSAPTDCTAFVLGGLWPIELAAVTAETATLADYLDADLQRIAGSANEKLHALSRAGLAGSARAAAEARVLNVARAFAVLRVESTVRQLRHEALDLRSEYLGLNSAQHAPETTQHVPRVMEALEADVAKVIESGRGPVKFRSEPVLGEPVETPAEPRGELRRLLTFVARQEPALRWAIGTEGENDPVLVTDLAHGWIPPGVDLPAGVRLLAPGRCDGGVSALLGAGMSAVSAAAVYAPGDRLGRAADSGPVETSPHPRELPEIEDLGWLLTEATHWRDGLPRMANTLAKAGAAGTGVADAEIDLLRVHLDTARYQLLAQYPDVDPAVLLNCLLLAATAGIATGDRVAANYHFAWFQTLSAPPTDSWDRRPRRRRETN